MLAHPMQTLRYTSRSTLSKNVNIDRNHKLSPPGTDAGGGNSCDECTDSAWVCHRASNRDQLYRNFLSQRGFYLWEHDSGAIWSHKPESNPCQADAFREHVNGNETD
jgi:hypothetical protein